MKKFFEFIRNLFKRDEIEFKIDRESGTVEITSKRDLTVDEIKEILRKHL